jgi:hypothetical protein
MGQYHHPVCIEAEEGFVPHNLGCGLKEAEQIFTRPGTCAALVALVSARGGNMPADYSQSPLVGRWAGKRVLVQGDYAEDGDIPDWDGPPLSLLYHALRSPEERGPWEGMTEGYWDTVPVFADLSEEAAAFLEGACSVRFFGDNWRTFAKVKPVAREFGQCGVGEYVLDTGYGADDLAYFKRAGMQPIDIQRVPRSSDWHGIRPHEMAEGQRRVIANLDRREYLDPVKFGQVPTLAGLLADRGPPPWPKAFAKADPGGIAVIDVAGALFAFLCHPARRGGGDLPANYDEAYGRGGKQVWRRAARAAVKGRWRGGRILGTAEFAGHPDWPTTDEVVAGFADISDPAINYLVALSHF